MTKKRTFLETRKEKDRLQDLTSSQAFKQEFEVARRVGIIIDDIWYRLRCDPESLQYHFDYGQNRDMGGGKQPISLLGNDPADMNLDTEDDEYKRVQAILDTRKLKMEKKNKEKPIPQFRGE
jgi:hypothetical protein